MKTHNVIYIYRLFKKSTLVLSTCRFIEIERKGYPVYRLLHLKHDWYCVLQYYDATNMMLPYFDAK